MNLETLLEAAKFLDSVATSPTDVVPRETELSSDSNLLLGSSESSPFQGSISESSLYRSTSSSSVNTGSNSVALRRSGGAGTREVHNKLEKGRRAHLKECFVILKKHIPNAEERKTSNLSILRLALDHIETLKRNEKELQDLLEKEQTRYSMLQQSRANCRGFLENAAMPAVTHHASSPSTDTAEDSPIASEDEFESTNSAVNLCSTSATSSMMSSSREPNLPNFIFGSQYIPTSSMPAAYLEQLRKQHSIAANFQPGSQTANPTSQSGSLFAGLSPTTPGLLSNIFGSHIVFNSSTGVIPPYDQSADRSALMTNSYDQTYSNKSLSLGQGANSALPAFALSPQFLSHYSAVSLASPSPQLGSAPVSFSTSSSAPVHTPLGINLTSPINPVLLQQFLNNYSDQSLAFQSDILANNKTLPIASPHPASDLVLPVYPSASLVPVSLPSNPMTVSYATCVGLVPASTVSSMAPASGDHRPIKPAAGQTDRPNLLLGSTTSLSLPQETVVKSGGLIMNTPLSGSSGSSARQNRSAVQMRLQQTIAQRAKLHQQQKQVENAVCTETSVRFVTSAMHTSALPSSSLDVKNLPTTVAMARMSTNSTSMPSPRHLPIATSYLANNRLVMSNPNVMSNVMTLSDASASSGGVMASAANSSLNAAAAAAGSTPPLQFISQEMLLQLMRDQSSAGKQNLIPFPVSQSLGVNPDSGSSNLGQLFVICPMSPSYQLGPLVTPVHVINSPFTSMGLSPDGPRPLLLDSRGGVTPQQYSFATRPNNFTAFTRS